MSEYKIALIAEGITDYVLIEAVLNAIIIDRPFVLTQLQPEPKMPHFGQGWGGVLRWCDDAKTRHAGFIEDDPTLVAGFDLVIVHLDVDVSSFDYQHCGDAIVQRANTLGWGSLPCVRPCPPVRETVEALNTVVNSWLHPVALGDRSTFCFPAQSSGAWLAIAILPAGHALLQDVECNVVVESALAQLPKALRVKKNRREYVKYSPAITERWDEVKRLCDQAVDFEQEVLAKLGA